MNDLLALAIHSVPQLNPIERFKLAQWCTDNSDEFQNFKELDVLELKFIKKTLNRTKTFRGFNGAKLWDSCERLYEKLEKRNIEIVHLFAKNYPPLLREIYGPPFLLFYMGHLPDPERPCLGVVGTRKPSIISKNETAIFVREVAPYVGSIVSGLALGIDTIAHRATLAVQGHTVGVMGAGFDNIYPKTNRKLVADIVNKGGAILTEYAPHTVPSRHNFPVRNRIISGISRSILVVEAPHKSGALITANHANDQGRDVYIHHVGLQYLGGTWKLYQEGAAVLQRGSDLLSSWGIDIQIPVPEKEIPKTPPPQVQERSDNKHVGKIYDLKKLIAEQTARDIGLGFCTDSE